MRGTYNGNYPETRPLGLISKLVVHHEASDLYLGDNSLLETVEAVRVYHVDTNGWPGIGYHYIYSPKFRQFAWVGDWETVRYHADGGPTLNYRAGINNVTGLGICIAGDYEFKDPDDTTLSDLKSLLDMLGQALLYPSIRGHREVSATVCPGNGWKATGGGWKDKVLPPWAI